MQGAVILAIWAIPIILVFVFQAIVISLLVFGAIKIIARMRNKK